MRKMQVYLLIVALALKIDNLQYTNALDMIGKSERQLSQQYLNENLWSLGDDDEYDESLNVIDDVDLDAGSFTFFN